MSAREFRPVRNLAAWGYESDGRQATGNRLEIDVWTVNPVEGDELPDPSELSPNVDEVLEVAGNVAKVRYKGIGTVGYRYIDVSETNPGIDKASDATQQAFAGAARAAGGDRTGEGTFEEGARPAVQGPALSDVIAHGEDEVLPVVRREMPELGSRVTREPRRDEDEEQVETEPFDGYDNVIRIILDRPGSPTGRYTVDDGEIQTISSPY